MENKRSYTVTLLLSTFLGWLGLHRFYTKHTLIGVIQLLTFGGCGIWALIDLVLICLNRFYTADEQELEKYNPTLAKVILGVLIACIALWGIIYITIPIEFIKSI